MKILPLIPNLQTKNSAQRTELNNRMVIQPKLAQALQRDTVSFTGAPNKISDFVAKGVSDNMERLQRIATTYLDILESVAGKLKDDGVYFDRAYCELQPVKSPESYTSKVVRSGSFKIPDAIRATLYLKNPYDLSILNDKLLPEMQKRGYILAHTDVKHEELIKRGYITPPAGEMSSAKTYSLPDLDIRLEDAMDNIEQLSPELKFSIGKPQKSGYEDIQMRFIREFDKKKNPIQHELIVLFGPNYAHAKHIESEKVYANLREFSELRIKLDEKQDSPHATKASRYIDLIRKMFTGKVSEKLFLNAKNKDLYDISEEIPIHFDETDTGMFINYFGGLKDRIKSCYKEAKTAAKPSNLATKQLNNDYRHDSNLLKKIQDNLMSTIDYFNYQHKLKNPEA